MWNPLTKLSYPQIEIPDPETPSAERVLDGITDFIIRYPVPVVASIFAIAIVVGWRRGGVFKGIIIGAALVMAALFLMRAAL